MCWHHHRKRRPEAPDSPAAMKPTWTKIGLGTATFGREINQEQSFVMMDHAREKGVNHFDTAAAYSKGESERIIGQWLASRRPPAGSLFVTTKAWFPYTANL